MRNEALHGRDRGIGGNRTGGRQPPQSSRLEKRVDKLEEKLNTVSLDLQVSLGRIEVRLDQTVNKADLHEMGSYLHKALNEQTWKFIAVALSMSALCATVAFGLAGVVQ